MARPRIHVSREVYLHSPSLLELPSEEEDLSTCCFHEMKIRSTNDVVFSRYLLLPPAKKFNVNTVGLALQGTQPSEGTVQTIDALPISQHSIRQIPPSHILLVTIVANYA